MPNHLEVSAKGDQKKYIGCSITKVWEIIQGLNFEMSKGHKEVMGSKNYTKEESP
jgi:hypothetical protein